MVERRIVNPLVGGSNPPLTARAWLTDLSSSQIPGTRGDSELTPWKDRGYTHADYLPNSGQAILWLEVGTPFESASRSREDDSQQSCSQHREGLAPSHNSALSARLDNPYAALCEVLAANHAGLAEWLRLQPSKLFTSVRTRLPAPDSRGARARQASKASHGQGSIPWRDATNFPKSLIFHNTVLHYR